ncbi:MAG: zinc ABC transporter substrate-binding protein [Chloroflexi bacterium]|nr:MAG: zinc ABC transporter substrate-binding protein [Chloroflexota bacterium]
MRKADRRVLLVATAVMILTVVLVVLALTGTAEETDSDTLVVAVTILPQAGFVEAIGGDKVEVLVMVPPGASPHIYEVTPDQMIKLSRAKMYVKVGLPVEFELAWMDKLIAANVSMRVVDCSEGIQVLEMDENHHDHDHEQDHGHTGLDPHIWLSVRNAAIMVQNIRAGLALIDPANEAYYEKNCADYLEQLEKLDSEITESLSEVENRRFIVFHPAWGYFARDYDLIQIAVEQDGKEPNVQYQVRLIEEARERDIRVVFVSPQYSAKRAQVIAGAIGGRVVIIDPLAKDFIGNMRLVASAMKEAME